MIVIVRPDDLEGRAVVKLDEHFMLERSPPQLDRERLIDAPYPGVRVDLVPDRLASLGEFRKAMPPAADAPMKGDARPVERDLVFAPATVSDLDCALAAGPQIAPEGHLMAARSPAVGGDFDFGGCACAHCPNIQGRRLFSKGEIPLLNPSLDDGIGLFRCADGGGDPNQIHCLCIRLAFALEPATTWMRQKPKCVEFTG